LFSFVSLIQYLSRRSLSSCPSLKFFLQMSVLRRSTTFFVCVGKRLLPQPSQKKKHDCTCVLTLLRLILLYSYYFIRVLLP
jgi:hypothetical protein